MRLIFTLAATLSFTFVLAGCRSSVGATERLWNWANEPAADRPEIAGITRRADGSPDAMLIVYRLRESAPSRNELNVAIPLAAHGRAVDPFTFHGQADTSEQIVRRIPTAQRRAVAGWVFDQSSIKQGDVLRASSHLVELESSFNDRFDVAVAWYWPDGGNDFQSAAIVLLPPSQPRGLGERLGRGTLGFIATPFVGVPEFITQLSMFAANMTG